MANPAKLLGKNLTISIAGLTIDNTGTITVATVTPMAGKAERGDIRFTRENEVVAALDADLADHLAGLKDWTLQLSGIKRRTGNPIEELAMAFDHAQIIITTPTKVITFQGLIEEFSWPIERLKNSDTITLIPIETGSANPAYVAAP